MKDIPRTATGAPRVRITPEQAQEIRAAYADPDGGAGAETLAARYHTSTFTIRRILSGEHLSAKGMPNIAGTRGSSWARGFRRSSPRGDQP